MILDALKRLFGGDISSPSNQTRLEPTPPSSNYDGRLVPFGNETLPPDIHQIESEFAHINQFMEQQMRSIMGSFGFMFGSPFAGIGFGDDFHKQPHGTFPFSFGIQDVPEGAGVFESPQTELDPRDEVLKPQFRSRLSEDWSGQDQILDDRLKTEGLGSIMDKLKPSVSDDDLSGPSNNILNLFGNGLFRGGLFESGDFSFRSGQESGSSLSSSTVTIYSNVNGHKSVEKIVRHPDGTVERTVINDRSPQEPI